MAHIHSLRINYRRHYAYTPDIDCTVSFPGDGGEIMATAIRRLSKNHYGAFVIMKDWATKVDYTSMKSAIEYLQYIYDDNARKLSPTCGKNSAPRRG